MSLSVTSQPCMTRMIVGRFYPKQKDSALVLQRQFQSPPISRWHRINQSQLAWGAHVQLRHDKVGKLWIWWYVQTCKLVGIKDHAMNNHKLWQFGMVRLIWVRPELYASSSSLQFSHQITLNPYSTCRPCTTQCSLTGFRILVIKMNDNVHSFDFHLKNIKSLFVGHKRRSNSPSQMTQGVLDQVPRA